MSKTSSAQTSRSLVRQNFHEEAENMINNIVNMVITAGYQCVSISYFFEKDTIALYGFSQLFRTFAKLMRKCAKTLMCYQVQRGGKVILDDIPKPEMTEWNMVNSLEYVLEKVKLLNEQFLKCHDLAEKNNDANLEDFLEHKFIRPFVVYMQKISFYIVKARRVTEEKQTQQSGLGEYIFDMDLIRENAFNIDKYSVTTHTDTTQTLGHQPSVKDLKKGLKNLGLL